MSRGMEQHAAALEGIASGASLDDFSQSDVKGAPLLPLTMEDALTRALASDFNRRALPPVVVEQYAARAKRLAAEYARDRDALNRAQLMRF